MMANTKRTLAELALVAALGIVYFILLASIWGVLPQHNPLFAWMLDNLAGSGWLYPLVWLQDLVINVALCLPLALLIHAMPVNHTSHRAYLLAAAILPAFIHHYWPLLPGALDGQQVLAWVGQLGILPLAYLLVLCVRRPRSGSAALQ